MGAASALDKGYGTVGVRGIGFLRNESADDLEVKDGLLESTEQPQPDGQQHLRAPCRRDVPQIDNVVPAEASEQLGHRLLGVRVVAANKHGVVGAGK